MQFHLWYKCVMSVMPLSRNYVKLKENLLICCVISHFSFAFEFATKLDEVTVRFRNCCIKRYGHQLDGKIN